MDGIEVTWKGKTYRISGADYAAIQRAYYAMCEAEGTMEAGTHYQLVNAFHQAGIRGLSKQDARKLGAQIC
ncbi:MAG: hypothetical protein ACFLMY_05030 [Candidatus Brachytrichaceae bacterium NZ_4S206]|jgi:hypothetical protein